MTTPAKLGARLAKLSARAGKIGRELAKLGEPTRSAAHHFDTASTRNRGPLSLTDLPSRILPRSKNHPSAQTPDPRCDRVSKVVWLGPSRRGMLQNATTAAPCYTAAARRRPFFANFLRQLALSFGNPSPQKINWGLGSSFRSIVIPPANGHHNDLGSDDQKRY